MDKSVFWKPVRKGESIQGKFERFEKSKFGLVVKLQKQEKIVPLRTVLRGLFQEIYSKLRSGDLLKVVYVGTTKKNGKGKPADLYQLFWKGKEVVSAFKARPATRDDVDEFFDDTSFPPRDEDQE